MKGWKILNVKSPATFSELCASQGIPYTHGCGYYQLAKAEEVAETKLLVGCNESTGEVICGTSDVRKQLNLPQGRVSIRPTMVPENWTLYVNSTSSNRRLPVGVTAIVRLGNASKKDLVSEAVADNEGVEAQAEETETHVEPAKPPTPKRAARAKAEPVEKAEETAKPNEPVLSDAPNPRKRPAVEHEDGISGIKPNQDDGDGWRWYDTTLMVYETTPRPAPSPLVAAFDYDGCLANTSLFKKGPDAWSILFPGVTEAALRELHMAGYKLVIMTNQSDIGRGKASRDKMIAEKKGRLCGFVNKVNLPFQILVATADKKDHDEYRKPGKGMWRFLSEHANGGIAIDMKKSFFVGDAAGRKKDHSDSDLQFAKATGAPFFTETDFFKEGAYKTLLS